MQKAKPPTAVKTYATEAKIRIKPSEIKANIRRVLEEKLRSKAYQAELVTQYIKDIADKIKDDVMKLVKNNRYKIIVHVTLGQKNNQGIRSGTRCFWDPKNDNCVSDVFVNDTIFCLASVYAIYLY